MFLVMMLPNCYYFILNFISIEQYIETFIHIPYIKLYKLGDLFFVVYYENILSFNDYFLN